MYLSVPLPIRKTFKFEVLDRLVPVLLSPTHAALFPVLMGACAPPSASRALYRALTPPSSAVQLTVIPHDPVKPAIKCAILLTNRCTAQSAVLEVAMLLDLNPQHLLLADVEHHAVTAQFRGRETVHDLRRANQLVVYVAPRLAALCAGDVTNVSCVGWLCVESGVW
jgi:hypothetical protein